MGEIMRRTDWGETVLGTPEKWPQSLCTTIGILLGSQFPMSLFWSDDHICFYNDAYRPSLGDNGRHPGILGKAAARARSEIWDGTVSPMVSRIMREGGSIWSEDQLIPILRNGRTQDVYWTFSHCPVRNGAGEIAGVLVVCTETTDAIRADKKLTESEKRFRTMAEGTSIMIALGDENGKSVYFNGAWSKFTGRKMEAFLDSGWTDLVHAEDRDHLTVQLAKSLKKKEEWETECRFLDNKGQYRWVLVQLSPRFEADGTYAGSVSAAIDIHERRTHEQEATKFRFMADNASDPFILMCEDGSFEYLNEATLKKWGYTRHESESLKLSDVNPDHDHERFGALFARAQKFDVPMFETVQRTKDGKKFPVEAKVSGFSFNGHPHMLAITRDISERKIAETALRESEHRFRELADQSPMWIWMTDAEVNVEYANRELLDYIGLGTVPEFTGQVWVDIVHPRDIGTVYKAFGDAVGKRTGFSVDYRVRRAATGVYEWFTVKAVPRFKAGKLSGFIGTGMNVHRQKSFSRQLKKEVRIRTQELADSNARLEKSNRELQSFAYISSHDLQEPLRKIQTFCSILASSEYERLSERGRDKFDRMRSAANRMQVLINDLLAYSRLDTEERKFETMDLAEIVSEVKADLAEDMRDDRARVEVKSSCDIDIVPFQFRQLLYNLVSNSLKYSREDVPASVDIEGKIVGSSEIGDERATEDAEYSMIRVIDNGIGFDDTYSDKIFKVFQRLHGRETYRGTSVGLAIVKKIAENHSGFVMAKGRPGEGSTFEVFIPRRNGA